MIETPVLLIFFNRPSTLLEVFSEIRKNRPKKLYLFQDGPRNEHDATNIRHCRDIVENIDWDCEIHRQYCEENNGCGLGPYKAISWAFQNEDKLIILEDDCVPSMSFFGFCEELLNRYQNDNRVFLITGCNMQLQSQTEHSYFFGYSGTNWGWATWKRCWMQMDYNCEWINDIAIYSDLYAFLRKNHKRKAKIEIDLFERTNKQLSSGADVGYWDVQFQATRYLFNQLSIIPCKNLITNIGFGDASTHAKMSPNQVAFNRKVGRIRAFNNERFELEFPLSHPTFCIQNSLYDSKVDKYLYGVTFGKLLRSVSRRIKRLFGR